MNSAFFLLLPIVFILHDLEEIITVKHWITNNKSAMIQKTPKFAHTLITRFSSISTEWFACIVMAEFIIFTAVGISAAYFGFVSLWIGLFVAYTIHLFWHSVQSILFRKYTPGLITVFISLAYAKFVLDRFLTHHPFSFTEYMLWTFIALILIGAVFVPLHMLGPDVSKSKHS
ncbi:MAG: HXXEE domain-containing protein [Bacteroidetes bacterium]|nr:HXXEE domain-containing protein [Bacteroidota bacterium]